MKKAVVFGGSGFLGSYVVDELTSRGLRVTVFDKRLSPFLNDKRQEMIIGDLLNKEEVENVIAGADYVFHFAAQADIGRSKTASYDTIKQNILGTTHILEACVKHQVEQLFFASSIYVYSEHGSIYKSTKQACEILIESYAEEFNLGVSILRYGSLYGPRSNDFNFIYNSIKSALANGRIERLGDGQELREYIHVADAARITVDLIFRQLKSTHYIITGNQSIKVADLLKMINEILGNKIDITYLEGKMDGHYQFTPYTFKPRVAQKIVPTEFHDLGQGLLETIYDIYEHLGNQAIIHLD
jgi:UDP-glucose 4-epimerase